MVGASIVMNEQETGFDVPREPARPLQLVFMLDGTSAKSYRRSMFVMVVFVMIIVMFVMFVIMMDCWFRLAGCCD